MRKKLSRSSVRSSIVARDAITTTIRDKNIQYDSYRSSTVRPMRLKVRDKDPASSDPSNRSLLLRHIHPVNSGSTVPGNQILLGTSRVVEARGRGEDIGSAEEF